MRAAIAIAIMVLVIAVGGLAMYILVRRFAALVWSAVERRARTRLTMAAREWLAGETDEMPATLRHLLPFPDQRLLVEICLELLPGADPAQRQRILGWLERQGQIQRWIAQLRARSPWRRAHAAELLGIVRVSYSIEPLVARLHDPVFDVRMRAARALGRLGGRQARTALVRALSDDNRWSVIRITDLLRHMGGDVVHELIADFDQLGRAARLAVVDLVSQLGDSSTTAFLAGLLEDLDRDIRARAAAALGRVGDGGGIAALRLALYDSEWPVRAMAAKALGELGAAPVVPQLCDALADDEWWVRANAAQALTRLGPKGLEALFDMLDHTDAFARDQALAQLEATGELDRRLAGLASPQDDAASAALRLLQSLEDWQPRELLARIRDRQPNPAVRRAIDAASRDPHFMRVA